MDEKENWTIRTLKEYFERILLEKDKAISIALDAAKEAVQIAEITSEKWRANANEWRGAMTDKDQYYLLKGEFYAYKDGTEKTLNDLKEMIKGLEKLINIGQGKGLGGAQVISYAIIALSAIGSVISIFVALSK